MNPASFGYKCSWLAVADQSPSRVIELLPVHDAKAIDWSDGILAAYRGRVFVSPPVEGWSLVVSAALPWFGNYKAADTLTEWIIGVSRRLDTVVQYFMTHRGTEYHAWCWAERGQVIRAHGWSGETGETVADVGASTKAEDELGIQFFDERSSHVANNEDYWARKDLAFPDEEYVMRLAEKWSVNPTVLGDSYPELGQGWLGRLRATCKLPHDN
jgi:hypothetical protein